jgi:apolipoprotein N-acyltransferase
VTAVRERDAVAVTVPPAPESPVLRPAWLAAVTAVVAGFALLLSFPPSAQWWLAPVGVAILLITVYRQRLRRAAWLGLLAGLAFFVPLLSWTGIQVGRWPWLALATLQASYLLLFALGVAWVSPLADARGWRRVGWPFTVAALFVADEAARDRTPFGGFPWGRLAFSQSDSPALRFAVLGGAPLVTFVVALLGALLATAVLAAPWGRAIRGWPAWRPPAAAAAAAIAGALIGFAVPTAPATGRPVTVAIIQGNVPRLGLEFNAQRLAVLQNHVNATLELANQVAAGQATQPDLVIWPENASDVDPVNSPDGRQLINQAAAAIGVPILVGGLIDSDNKHPLNVGIVWTPGSGPGATYIKRHPVPFAEYIPLRSLARRITTKVDLVRNDFVAGDEPGILSVGPATVGDVICFEVAYDGLVRDTVTGGGQLIAVQTNNATFNPAEARQQLAMVQLRAIEHGRDSLMVSTVGISAFVTADGEVSQATGFNTQAVRLAQLHLGEGHTVATRLGELPEWVVVAGAILGLALATRRRWVQARAS